MQVCYFTNVYPAPSHTTMRREIRALEAQGARVIRVAARRFCGSLVEPADHEEARKTVYTASSIPRALTCLFAVALKHPLRLARALLDAVLIGSQTRSGVWKHLMYVGEACVLLRLARGCDHIHANFANATNIAIMCRVLGGPPVSLRLHGPEEFDSFTPAEWDWKLRHSAFVAPISDYGSRKVRESVLPRHHGKIRTLRCGVEANLHSPAAVAASPLPGALRLVCVARLEARKGHNVLFEAIAALRSNGLPVTLQLIGDGALRESLKQLARELSICGAVEFAGWQDSAGVLQAMRKARVVVLPSLAEGLPIVLMEALAVGTLVVATRVAGIPELVIPGQTGWLASSGDVAGLAVALREALLLPDERVMEMARTGRALVAERHDVNKLMRSLLSHMRQSEASALSPERSGAIP